MAGAWEPNYKDVIGPTFQKLRPKKPAKSPDFPVYDHLEEILLESQDPDDRVAHVMATGAAYAYSGETTVAMMATRLGLEENICRMISLSVDAMFISSNAFLVQSRDGRVVIICYRGTPPLGLITYFTDADSSPEKVDIPFPGEANDTVEVHEGWYRNVMATRYAIIESLQHALDGHSITGEAQRLAAPEALYITGHSLGGAMAAIMAIMLKTETEYEDIGSRLKAVYTFGQPMVGSPGLAHACREDKFLSTKVIRYIYNNDIAPQTPPVEAGAFAHFGREFKYRGSPGKGRWRENDHRPTGQIWNPVWLMTAPLAFMARQTILTRNIRFPASLDDHFPEHYISALAPPGVKSEFGG
jgi:Lipase (class 3)